MASIGAYVANWVLKHTLKPKLEAAKDAMDVRRLLRPEPFKVPRSVRITPDRIGGVPGEWVEAEGSDVTLLYLHGGGYVACSAEVYRGITVGFALNGLRVFAPDYRMAPEHVFPAAIEDAVAVYRGLSGKVVVAGDSAGGGLALGMLLTLRDAGDALPAALVLLSPWTDLAATGDSLVTNDRRCALFRGSQIGRAARFYLGDTDPKNPIASPLYADLSGLPPMLIHVGKNETLLDDSTRLAERARAAGVKVELKIWPVVPHVWQLVPALRESRQSLREVSRFLLERALV
jgi:epsilon-lactone hydrolase